MLLMLYISETPWPFEDVFRYNTLTVVMVTVHLQQKETILASIFKIIIAILYVKVKQGVNKVKGITCHDEPCLC